MDRDQAYEALKLRIEDPGIILHSLVVEAIMRFLARHFHEDVEMWGVAGLVHDIDHERIDGNMALHGKMGGDILEGLDFDRTIVYAVKAHNPGNNIARRRKMDKALFCASPMADLLLACAGSLSQQGIHSVDTDMIMRCYNDPDFAKDINRDRIAACNELDLSIDELAEISLKALQENKQLLKLVTGLVK